MPDLAIDWDQWLVDTALQGLVPLVYSGLGELNLQTPEAVRRALHAGAAENALRHRRWYEPALRQTLATLSDAGIRPIVLKGSALAYLAYRTPIHRTLRDIDLLLAPNELDRAADCLLQHGYLRSEQALPSEHHHLPALFTPDGRTAIELHHHVLQESNPYAIDQETLTARSELRRIADFEACVLGPTDTLLHICVHLAYGHRYRWYPLRTLTDILALTTRTGVAIDWDLLENTVQSTRTAGAIYWPLRLSQRWLGAPIPESVLNCFAPPAATRRLMEPVLESPYALNDQSPPERGANVLYNLVRELSLYAGCPAAMQLRVLLSTLFPPRHAITHLSDDLTQSRFRFAAHWWNPPRVVRGLVAFGRLLAPRLKPVGDSISSATRLRKSAKVVATRPIAAVARTDSSGAPADT
jgi:hypothetical protein